MTTDELLARFPFDPAKRGHSERYNLPHKLACIDDERLRHAAATGWLTSSDGKHWVAVHGQPTDDWRNQ